MHNDGIILLAVLNLYCELKFVWRHSTLIFPSLTVRRQPIAASIKKLPNSVVKLVGTARCFQSRYVSRNDQVIDQFEVSR